MTPPKPVVLCILDGWGLRAEREANAIALAETPVFDRIWATAPRATLKCSGADVGLPDGQMGNSEVGHMNIGAGRIVWMDLPKIDKAIEEGRFADAPALTAFADALLESGGTAHVMGLLSPGGVHAHQRHIAAAARALSARGAPVVIHAFLDGRDTPPKSAARYLETFAGDLAGAGRIATVTGRFYAMDRDKRWDRVQAAFDVIVSATSDQAAQDAVAAALGAYSRGETDEFAAPTVIGGYGGARDGDGVLFMNFRADRARELLSAIGDPDFDDFDVSARPDWAAICGIVDYSEAHGRFMSTIYPADEIADTLGAWVAAKGKTQLRLAETEKYPHVTFFLNGGEETVAEGERRHMAQSPKVRTYDLAPEMASGEVTEALVGAIRGGETDLIVVNYANPDMVGHTGDLDAAIRACASVDRGLGAALEALEAVGGAMIVTADHGNCEMMVDPESGEPHTAHTLNEAPVILVGGPEGARLREGGRLADLAPTLLELMGLDQPAAMTGASLIARGGA